MPWAAIWKTISGWPAAIAAGARLWWPQIKVALAGAVAVYGERLRNENAGRRQQIANSAAMDDAMRRGRTDGAYLDQLRRESGDIDPPN